MMDNGLRALVVDDNMVNRLLATRMLERLGWTVSEAEDGQAALDFLDAETVDLVLLDISMPGLSGEAVCRTIRAKDQKTRIIAYTAHVHPGDQDRLLEGGFNLLLAKPITLDRLVEALGEVGFPVTRS